MNQTPVALSDAVKALTELSAALFERDPKRASSAAGSLAALTPPPWLSPQDLSFYRGVAAYAASDLGGAEPLLRGASGSIVAAEAHWLLAQIASSRITEANQTEQRPRYHAELAEVAALAPRSPMASYVADVQTDAREAVTPPKGPRSVPHVHYGERFSWQEVERAADLYRRERMYAEAAELYRLSLTLRYPAEWRQDVASAAHERIADCHEARGDRGSSLRWLAAALALPISPAERARLSNKIIERDRAAPVKPEAPAPKGATLREIGAMLKRMELFEEAISAYRRAGEHGAPSGADVASTLEDRASFLLHYRRARSERAMLFGAPLDQARLSAAFREAKDAWANTPGDEGRAGVARCDEGLTAVLALP